MNKKSNTRWLSKPFVSTIIAYGISLALAFAFSLKFYRMQKAEFTSATIHELRQSLKTAMLMQDKFASHFYYEHLMRDEIMTLMRQANSSDPAMQVKAREQLAALIDPVQQKFRQLNITHLHFHLPDNTSFFRTHHPDRFGDNLASFRPTVVKANRERVHVSGLDAGRFLAAYRNVYPLIDNDGTHLGSVGLSMDIDVLLESLEEVFFGEYALLLNTDRLPAEARQTIYTGLELSPRYVFVEGFRPTTLQAELNTRLEAKLPRLLSTQQGAVQGCDVDAHHFIISFLPLQDVTGTHIGYIVSYREDSRLFGYYQALVIRTVLLSSLVTLVFIVILIRLQEKQRKAGEEQKLKRLVEGTGAGIWNLNLQTGDCEFNDYWLEMLGYPISWGEGKTVTLQQFVAPEDIDVIEQALTAFRTENNPPSELSFRLVHRSGKRLWCICRLYLISWTIKGRPEILSGITLDITFTKQMEESIRKSEQRLNKLYQAMPDPVIVFNVKTRKPVSWNRKAMDLFGENADDFRQQVEAGFMKADEEQNNELLDAIFSRDGVHDIDTTICIGASKTLEVKVSSSQLVVGEETLCLVIVHDMSKEKQNEAQLMENIRLKNDFISMISHELRTPLFSILGFSSMLLKDNATLDAETRTEFLNIIHDESTRLSMLIEDVLTISRIDAGKNKYHAEVINPADLITEVIELMRQSPINKHQEILLQLPVKPVHISFDQNALKQVLTNLLSNAMKFTQSGGVITLRFQQEDEHKAVIEVEDTGMGIPEHDFEAIFDKFYRSEHSAGTIQGTGLGLAIVKDIVETHGGTVEVSSMLGKGSTFRVSLPTVDEQEGKTQPA